MKVWIWLKPTGLEHKYRPALFVKTRRWFLNVLTLDPFPTYSWVVALGVWKAEGISCLSLPCIPLNNLRAFILIVVSSLWANINLNKMMEVTNVILLEAVGWGIGLPAVLWLWSNKMLPPGASNALHHLLGSRNSFPGHRVAVTTPAIQNWEEEALVTPFLAIVDTAFVDQNLLLLFPQ